MGENSDRAMELWGRTVTEFTSELWTESTPELWTEMAPELWTEKKSLMPELWTEKKKFDTRIVDRNFLH